MPADALNWSKSPANCKPILSLNDTIQVKKEDITLYYLYYSLKLYNKLIKIKYFEPITFKFDVLPPKSPAKT